MRRIILASESPRRRELMAKLDVPFTVKGAQIDETLNKELPLYEAIEDIAYRKAAALAKKYPQEWIVSADTIVCLDDQVMGKPQDEQQAEMMLKRLSGRTHQVITAVCIYDGKTAHLFHEVSKVTFYALSEEEIKAYIATKEPLDKAGAYGIQGKGAFLVEKIEGDYYNIVGLPIARLKREMEDCLK